MMFEGLKPFSQLVGLCVMLLFGFLIATGLQLLVPIDMSTNGGIRLALVMQCVSQLLMFMLPALMFSWMYQGSAVNVLCLHFRGRHWLLALVAVITLMLLLPALDWVTYWNEAWDLGSLDKPLRDIADQLQEQEGQMLSLVSAPDLVLQLIVVALVPAVCEELFFRGAMQQILQHWFGNVHVAIIVTALIFSLAHGDVFGLVPRFLLGVLLGYMFYRSGSLLVNACVHFVNNAIVIALYYLYHAGVLHFIPSEPMQLPWYPTAMSLLGAVLLIYVYFIPKKEKTE